MSSLDRVIEEFKDLQKIPISNCGITVGLANENDYRLWKISIFGPTDTSYKGGMFLIGVKFQKNIHQNHQKFII